MWRCPIKKLKFKALVGKKKEEVAVATVSFYEDVGVAHISGYDKKGEFHTYFDNFELYQKNGNDWERVN